MRELSHNACVSFRTPGKKPTANSVYGTENLLYYPERVLPVLRITIAVREAGLGSLFVMFIHEMSEAECRKALEQATLGRLACVRDNRPYVVPIYFAFDGKHLYGFTTLGQKIEWMRSNPHVCVEIDERVSHNKWMSVIVFGRYEELPDEPRYEAARMEAHNLLQRRTMWWEPAFVASSHRDKPRFITPVFFRIHIERMTGHRATPDRSETNTSIAGPTATKEDWWSKVLRHIGLA
jgi:nitroimidazol reductase NimA-like FMN-containing flavoprotein (pyridoxamine 5'-phosphate oxidase superfamily)